MSAAAVLGFHCARPGAAWALLLPLLFVLALRLLARPPEVVVGTLELWEGLGASPSAAGRARLRLPPWARFTALALLLGALAWLGPRYARTSVARTWICVVDRSPSMGWSDGSDRSRLEAALAAALDWLARASGPDDRVRWLAAGREVRELARGERPEPVWLAPERAQGGEPEWELHDRPGVLWISDRAPAVARAHAGLFASGGPAVPGPIAADGHTTWTWEEGELGARPNSRAGAVRVVERGGEALPAVLERMLSAWCAARGFVLARATEAETLLEIESVPAHAGEELVLERDGWRASGRGALAESAGGEVWLAGRTRAGATLPVVRAVPGRIEVGLGALAEPSGDPALFALSWARLLDRWTLWPAGVVAFAERRAAGEPESAPGAPAPMADGPGPERGPTIDAVLTLCALLCALHARHLLGRGAGVERAPRRAREGATDQTERARAAPLALVFSAPMLLQDGAPGTLAGQWWAEAALWLGLALFFVGCACALAAWAAVRRLERLRGELRALEALPEIQRTLTRWLAERDDLDLRRIEHLLIDLRDGSKRVEELLLSAQERRALPEGTLVPLAPPSLAERVVSRLLALGYEHIELVTPHAELEAMNQGGGDVLVEARREGALCKGRVRVRAGRIEAVQLQPAFPIFP